MNSKSNTLSTNDSNKVSGIINKSNSREEAIALINHIEKIYDYSNFSYELIHYGKVDGKSHNHHAAEAHYILILSAILQNGLKLDGMDPKFIESVKLQINLMQKRFEAISDKSLLAGSILFLYFVLVKEYSAKGELHELIKSYKKFLSILPHCDVYEDGKLKFEGDIIQRAYSDFIAQFLDNLDIDIFANNPK